MDIQQVKLTAITKTRTENLLTKREELSRILLEARETLDRINGELMERVAKEPEHRLLVEDKTIQIVKRVSFTGVPLDYAEKLNATKQVIDAAVLKPLFAKGVIMPGVTFTEYILVK